MALRNIIQEGDPILHKKSRKVDKFDHRLHILLDDMAETMREANGVGLAAVQVGVLRRVVLVEADKGTLIELINPEITFKSEELQCGSEGCLSFPDEGDVVIRPNKVIIEAQDRDGKVFQHAGEGLKARAFCHELDHLEGIVFLDRVATDEELEQWIVVDEEGNESYAPPHKPK